MKYLKYLIGPAIVAAVFMAAYILQPTPVTAGEFGLPPVPAGVEILTDVTMTDTATATASFNTANFPRFNGDESLKLQGEAVLSSGSPTITATLQGSNFPTSDGLWYTLTTWTITGTEDTVVTVTAPPRYLRWSYSSTGSATTVINNAMQIY